MAISEAGAAVARFDFNRGEMRGTSMTLYANCLVHRGDFHLETVPLAALASVRVAFERDFHRIAWGGVLIFIALVLFAVSGPLAAVAATAAGEVATGATGVAAALATLFRIVEAIARLLPFLGVLAALGGGGLIALGWLGATALTLSFARDERIYVVRGRDTRLLDFAETLAERLMLVRR
jgi:hypothetical protein